MNAQINIDRIVDEAVTLADLTGPQTGTAPTPRVPRFDAPADQPPVDYEVGEDDDRGEVTPARARILLGEFFDEFPKDLLAAMAIEQVVGMRSATVNVMLGEWGEAYAKGLVSQPMSPAAFARFASDQYDCGFDDGATDRALTGRAS
ncbi:hypothetical protein [Ancylobacter defluvii]|uniref:Uncharacterized protein n=1 Tax=Ancylobacter defluvii TaxID=1282440 RepID=A0A9W6JTI0_9HYPH|nr:hypothetical protein [Ancylobacter defluvii]MBS7587885.1 hypothetical protein [Ancylobacter defluvii]GLK83565.1 hypothetical protein GCM10017653_16340 [Ancylobacter defluvii]